MQGIIIAIINIIGVSTIVSASEVSAMITEDSLYFIVSEDDNQLITE
jgi:hypothetical protein